MDKIKKLLLVKSQIKDLLEEEKRLKLDLLNDDDFDGYEEFGVCIKRVSKPTYKLNISTKELQERYPDMVEMKPKSPATLWKVDRSVVDRKVGTSLMITGL